jgi:hypothetical protein
MARDSPLVNEARMDSAGIAAKYVEDRRKVLLALLPERTNFSEIRRFSGALR